MRRAIRLGERKRRGHRRGVIGHLIVIATAIAFATFLIASEVTVASFARDERHRAVSDQAMALAESGVVAAEAWIESHESVALELSAVPLGPGTVDLKVAAEGTDVVIVSTGRVVASFLGGKPGPLARRLRVHLTKRAKREGDDGLSRFVVTEWKEL